jgi:hypothetical protein
MEYTLYAISLYASMVLAYNDMEPISEFMGNFESDNAKSKLIALNVKHWSSGAIQMYSMYCLT